MSSDPSGGGQPSSSSTGGGGTSRPRNPWLGNMFWSLGGLLWRYMKYILPVIVIIFTAQPLWNALINIGKNFKSNTVPEVSTGGISRTGQGQQFGNDSSDEESSQTVTETTPAPAETPAPTPKPTPTLEPTPLPKPTPAPTENLSAGEPQQEKEEKPAPRQEKVQVKKRLPVILVPRPREIIEVPFLPPPPAPKQVLRPAPKQEQVAEPEPRKPHTLSKEELDEISQKEIQKMKEEE